MSDYIYRFAVPVDGEWHEIEGCGTPIHIGCRRADELEFWAWSMPGQGPRTFKVVGTGHPVDEPVRYRGTAMAPGGDLIWHLLERCES